MITDTNELGENTPEWNSDNLAELRRIFSSGDTEATYRTQSEASTLLYRQVRQSADGPRTLILNAVTEVVAARYGLYIGRQRREDGDLPAAVTAFKHAVDADDGTESYAAAAELIRIGLELSNQGEKEVAMNALRIAMPRITGDLRAPSAFLLGLMCHNHKAVSIDHGDTVLRDQLIEDLDRLLPA